ncbi:hypothetical protein SCUP515_02261 [Seiridium cupressi]
MNIIFTGLSALYRLCSEAIPEFASSPPLRKAPNELQEVYNELCKSHNELQDKFRAMEAQHNQLALEKEQLIAERGCLYKNWQQRSKDLEETLRCDMDDLIRTCMRMQTLSIDQHINEMLKVTLEAENQYISSQELRKILDDEIGTLKAAKHQYASLADVLRSNTATVTEKISDLEQRLKDALCQIEIHETEVRLRKEELSFEKRRAEQALGDVDDLESKVAQLMSQVLEIKSSSQKTQAKVKLQTSKADRFRDKCVRLESDISDLHDLWTIQHMQQVSQGAGDSGSQGKLISVW